MTDEPSTADNLSYNDHRRAAALFLHFTDPEGQNLSGINSVLAEAEADQRIVELIAAMLVAAVETAPPLAGPLGRRVMANRVHTFARSAAETHS